MPALPTKHEMFLEVITAPMEGSAHLNAAFADSPAGSLLEVELVDS
ncbi:MAG TPA: hypothetical protein VGO89_06570 [Streptomyces sp.]|jgi:hypothetical protein|nr:hypothetical protein [Streptomyces sp.]